MLYIFDYFGNRIDVYPWVVWLTVGIISAITIAFYFLRSIGLYKMATNAKIDKKFMAFIPIVWVYIVSKLAGEVYFFGMKIKKFVFWILTVVIVAEVFSIAHTLMAYIPLIGYYLQGGDVIYTQGNVTIVGAMMYPFDRYFYVGTDFFFQYTQTYLNLVRALSYVSTGVGLISLFLCVSMYAGFFRKYWPRHVFLGVFLCIIGLFPILAFSFRNASPFDYQAYIRNMMQNMGYGDPNNPNNTGNNQSNGNDNPFGEFENKNDNNSSKNGSDGDPFDEFSDKGK